MRRKLYQTIFLLLFFFSTSVSAQEISLSVAPKPHFHSSQEKSAFDLLKKEDFKSQFMLLYALKPSSNPDLPNNHFRQLQEFVEELRPQVEKQNQPKKKISKVHKEVHKAFLKKYMLKNSFQDIFSRGEYNCVSATALYGLVLQELGIPFSVKETPVHVFLIAYPQTHRIVLESTDPQTGYMVFNAKFKDEYVSQLLKMKLISEEEVNSKGIETLFEEMYFDNQEITLNELIALQYYNDGLYLMEEEAYTKSLQQFEKAYLLYPSDRIGYLIYSTCMLGIQKATYSDTAYIDYVVRLANLQGIDKLQDLVKGEFALFTQDQLSKKSAEEHYDKMFGRLTSQIKDTSLVKEISDIYYFEKGRTAYNTGRFTEALAYTEKAFRLFPEDPDNSAMLAACLGQNLNTIYSLDEKISTLESYLAKYPELKNNNLMYSQLLQFYVAQFGQAYELQQEDKGKKYQGLFEKAYQQKMNEKEGYVLDPNLIGRAYSVAAVYYFRKGQTSTARRILDKGLVYAPENFELIQRKRMIR